MSIVRRIIFECDYCGDEEDTGVTDFQDALSHIREAGWIVRKERDEWQHYCCRDCANDTR